MEQPLGFDEGEIKYGYSSKLCMCQEWNCRGWRSKVIDKSTLWNGVMYYVREEYYLVMV